MPFSGWLRRAYRRCGDQLFHCRVELGLVHRQTLGGIGNSLLLSHRKCLAGLGVRSPRPLPTLTQRAFAGLAPGHRSASRFQWERPPESDAPRVGGDSEVSPTRGTRLLSCLLSLPNGIGKGLPLCYDAVLELECPKCRNTDVRPSMRRPWERLLVLLSLRPFRCVACYHRFLVF